MKLLATFAVASVTLWPQATPNPTRARVAAVVNAASFEAKLSWGSLVTVFGTQLAGLSGSADRLPLPKSINDVSVQLCAEPLGGCRALDLVYVNQQQINLVFPEPQRSFFEPLPAQLKVFRAGTEDEAASRQAPISFALYPAAPGTFQVGYDCRFPRNDCTLAATSDETRTMLRGAMTDGITGELITSRRPIRPRRPVTLWLTGLGIRRDNSFRGPSTFMTFQLNGRGVAVTEREITFKGVSPQFPGLYQINFQLPPDILRVISTPLPSCKDYELELEIVLHWTGAGEQVFSNRVFAPVLIRANETDCIPD